MKKFYWLLKYTGVWIIFLCVAGGYALTSYTGGKVMLADMVPFALIGVVISLLVWTKNDTRIRNGKPADDIGFLDGFDTNPDHYLINSGINKAKFPTVNKKLLYDKPTGFCFGKYKGQYVCRTPDMQGGIMVCGGAGSGKTTCSILPFVLNNKETMHSLIVDIKHEITDMTVVRDEGNAGYGDGGKTIIFDPLERTTFGYDPFYNLKEDSTDGEIYECMQLIAISIIPPGTGDAAFWSDTARSMLIACLIYFYKYKKKRTLTEIIKMILGAPIKDTIQEIVTTAPPDSDEYRNSIDFYGMGDETLMSTFSNLAQKITVFVSDRDLAFCLGNNCKKFSPRSLLEHNVMLCIPEHKLEQYGQLVFLILNQFFLWSMQLPELAQEPERKQIGVIIDETVALLQGVGAKLTMLPQALRVVRSKGVMIVVCVQSVSGLRCVMSEQECSDLLSNMPYKLFFDATTPETQKAICSWSGTYQKRSESWSGSGKDRKRTISFSEEPIVKPEDLMTLAGSGEAILITSIGGYNRIQKAPVYQEKYFKQLLETVKQKNENKGESKW